MKLKIVLTFFTFLILSSVVGSPNIATGDRYFREMNYRQAIHFYELDSNLAEAQWRIARAYICLSEISSKEEQKFYEQKAEAAALRCIKFSPHISHGHTLYAAALSIRAMTEGSKTKVALSNIIKKELETAISLNSHDDIAYSLLGSFYRTLRKVNWFERSLADAFLGGLPDGGFAESERAFKKAIEIAPHYIRHWEELGKLYIEEGKSKEAKAALLHVLKLKPQVQSDFKRIARTRELLKEL